MESRRGRDRKIVSARAEVHHLVGAKEARSTRAQQRHHDSLPGNDRGDAGADGPDHSGGLVAIDRREVATPCATARVEIARADGAGLHVDQDLARLGRVEDQGLDDQWVAETATHRSPDQRRPVWLSAQPGRLAWSTSIPTALERPSRRGAPSPAAAEWSPWRNATADATRSIRGEPAERCGMGRAEWVGATRRERAEDPAFLLVSAAVD